MKTIEDFQNYLKSFYLFVARVDLYCSDYEHYPFNIDYDNNEDAKQILKGFNELKTFNSKYNVLKKYVNLCFDKLFLFSHENNIFFHQCSFAVFESTFENRLLEYKNIFVDTKLIDFALIEIPFLTHNTSSALFTMLKHTNQKRVSDSTKKKFNFYERKFQSADILPEQLEPEPLDLSDSSIAEKIALLYESGIIEFLHKKDGKPHTVNSIASLLSGITGVDPKTIQSAINPFINTHSTSKGTPAKSTLNKAKTKIIDLGFNS